MRRAVAIMDMEVRRRAEERAGAASGDGGGGGGGGAAEVVPGPTVLEAAMDEDEVWTSRERPPRHPPHSVPVLAASSTT